MNLQKLFETQAELDKKIIEEKGLHGVDLLEEKILALQVDLGELANKWEGFKFWKTSPNKYLYGEVLEEYVDCLHFILLIGNDIGLDRDQAIKMINIHMDWILESRDVKNTSITEQFNIVFNEISNYGHLRGSDDYYCFVSEFFILGEKLGFTDKQVEQAYYEKNEINHERQANGY